MKEKWHRKQRKMSCHTVNTIRLYKSGSLNRDRWHSKVSCPAGHEERSLGTGGKWASISPPLSVHYKITFPAPKTQKAHLTFVNWYPPPPLSRFMPTTKGCASFPVFWRWADHLIPKVQLKLNKMIYACYIVNTVGESWHQSNTA